MQDPVITPGGHLFSKEAILQYFLEQKKLKKLQLLAWEADEARWQKMVWACLALLLVGCQHCPAWCWV